MDYLYLPAIDSPADLKKIPQEALPRVAEELRHYLITEVSKVGGHLASSLGAVELTLALQYIFDAPRDKIIWDVGHQAYGHKVITGRRDRLPPSLLEAIEQAEELKAPGRAMDLRLAIDYSGRQAILRAAERVGNGFGVNADEFSRLLAVASHAPPSSPDIDLLIRTGGERRLSDLPLWEATYAELYFTDRMWPDFDASDLALALDDFSRRERRFGRIPELAAS